MKSLNVNKLAAVCALSALFTVSSAHALTVYDVIQLSNKKYNNTEIIKLIDDTGSAFELTAEDIPKLIELGVSEPVVQSMLKAKPTAEQEQPE